jgi:predicted permease
VRQVLRAIARMPGLAAVVIVSLGVGIGVNTAVFTRLQFMILQPLPGVTDASTLHLVEPRTETGSYPGISWLEYRDLRERLSSFRDLIAARSVPFTVGEESRVERTFGQLVSGNFFTELGLRPALGRFLRSDEAEHIGREAVAVISYELWQSRFGGRATVVGETIHVNRHDLTIVGVAPSGFQGTVFGLQFDLWVPATLAQRLLAGSRELEDRRSRGYIVMGQLHTGTPIAQAQGDLDRAMADLARTYPETNATLRGDVISFWRAPRGPQRMLVAALGVLQTVMLVVLITICANTATLMLTRASERQREIGVRLAIGASRWRVAGLVLLENVVLALFAAALGAIVAIWATEAMRTMPMPGSMPFRFQTRVDALGFAFTTLLGLVCGLVFGAAPALQLARIDPLRAIRAGSLAGTPGRMRGVLMGTEVGLALVVLVVGVIFVRGFLDPRSTDTGFDQRGLLLATYDLTGRDVDARTFASRVQERLRTIPGVSAAAISVSVPLDIHGLPVRTFTLEGRARTDGGTDSAASNTVTPGYFEMMGIALRAGSDFADLRDTTAPPQAIVNEAFVERFLAGDGSAPVSGGPAVLGRRVTNGDRTYTIVGVVATSTSDAFGEPPRAALYFSYRDRPASIGEMHVRTRDGSEAAVAAEVRAAVRALDPTLPIYNVRTMPEHIERSAVLSRVPAQLFIVLGPMLLVLATIGIYGVVAHIVAKRTAEIGVRLALGATARRVVTEIVGQSLRVIGMGALAGWSLSIVIVFDLLERGVNEVPVLLVVPAVLVLVATLASWLPARRAATIDPMAALRHE